MLLVDICAKAKVWQGTAVGATPRKQTKNRAHRLVGSFFIRIFAGRNFNKVIFNHVQSDSGRYTLYYALCCSDSYCLEYY